MDGRLSLALDLLTYTHLGYYNAANGDLKYAHLAVSGWHIEVVENRDAIAHLISTHRQYLKKEK